MPASLTVQVRLGFSMGWRIWTPNEVGFYAKTLAHSYFILVILKSKFLKEMIWIVNYNLFMGTKKYHVFIEFLQFGMKSKDERCIWKKVMFISLVARHKKMTKAYFNFRDERFKLIMFKDKMSQAYPYIEDQKAVWKIYESRLFKSTRLGLKQSHDKKIQRLPSLRYKKYRGEIGVFGRPLIFLNKKFNHPRIFFNKYLKHKSAARTRLFYKIDRLFTSKFFSEKKAKQLKILPTKSLFISKFFKKVPFKKAENRSSISKKEVDSILGVAGRNMLTSKAEHTLMESFRYDPVFEKNKYSIVGGPLKRLSRNLRRAFKGKHVKVAADLVWFWQKVSKMLTYFVRKHVFYKNRVI